MADPCSTCGVCPSCGHLPIASALLFTGHEYINVTVPVPKTSERPTIVKVKAESFGCPTITIREESYKEYATSELIAIIKVLTKSPEKLKEKQWTRMRVLVESLEE